VNRVLIIAEHDGHRLSAATARCVQCALGLGESAITVVVFGHEVAAVARDAAQLTGVTHVRVADAPGFRHPLAAVLAPAVAVIARSGEQLAYSHVFGPSTTFGKDLMPRVAALLDVPAVSDVMAVESPTRFRRPIYAGNAIVTVEVTAQPIVATVRTASFAAVASAASSVPIESLDLQPQPVTHTRFVAVSTPKGDRPDLQSARCVVSGGRALGSAEKFQLIYQLADALGAAVGASRAAVDSGYAPNDLQVGQTGKIIAPELYVALGISGAIQHLTGIKDARTIVAINKDADAPIFEIADYGLVADLFEAVPALLAQLQTRART
jgi:electron transfer flavoprotein alpha subunit